MIERIRTRSDLETAVRRIDRYTALVKKYTDLLNHHREMVVHYLEIKNMKSYISKTGSTWQKRQSTSVAYHVDELRSLLRRKHIDPNTVIKQVIEERVDEEVLLKLLKGKVISVEEYETIAVRHTNKPYIVKVNARKKRESEPEESPIIRGSGKGGYLYDGTGQGAQFRKTRSWGRNTHPAG